jgi:Tfp pilus assembly protein PilN
MPARRPSFGWSLTVNPERMRTIGSWRLLFPVLMLVAAGIVAVLTVIGLLRIRRWQTAVVSVGILLSGSLLLCFAVARSYGPDALPWKPVDNE